jgi:uncharacterized protein (DUF2141 family)
MQSRPIIAAAIAGATLALAVTGASASMMNAKLGAHLSGMGDKGTVNLDITASSDKLCWTFDIPMIKDVTRATINTGSTSVVLLELGMDYTKSGCAKESSMTLEHLEAKASAYSVWVDTKAHPGDLRGTLATGAVM